jgi:hypothetical protein
MRPLTPWSQRPADARKAHIFQRFDRIMMSIDRAPAPGTVLRVALPLLLGLKRSHDAFVT